MNFRALKNQSDVWKSPENLFLEKGRNTVYNNCEFSTLAVWIVSWVWDYDI